jgi:hypothetical protein
MVSKTETVSTMFLMICCLQQPKPIVRIPTVVINRAEKLHNEPVNDPTPQLHETKHNIGVRAGIYFKMS